MLTAYGKVNKNVLLLISVQNTEKEKPDAVAFCNDTKS
jgi:hypothetical protein